MYIRECTYNIILYYIYIREFTYNIYNILYNIILYVH